MPYVVRMLAMLAAFLVLSAPAQAQDAAAYFHRGAQSYVEGELAEAKAAVEEGLRLAPSDPKLQALKEKLEQQQQQNSGSDQQDQNQQDQQNQQEQNQQNDASSDAQNEQEQQNPSGEQQDPQNEQPPQDSQQQQQEDQQDSEQQDPEEQQAGPQQGQPQPEDLDQLSREQALRILQALEQDEEQLLREVLKPQTRPRRVEKDW